MRDSFGPYLTGELARRGDGWSLYRGRHERSGAAVWMLRVDGAAARLDEIKRRIGALAQVTGASSLPTGLSPDGTDLVSITDSADYRPLGESTPTDTQVRLLVESSCAALAGLHETGLAHTRIDGWLVDARPDGRARLRGVAEFAELGSDAAQQEDARQLGRVLRHALRATQLPDDLAGALVDLSRGRRSVAGTARLAASEPDDGPVTEEIEAVSDDAVVERDLISTLRAPAERDREQSTAGRRRHAAPTAPLVRRNRMLAVATLVALAALGSVLWLTRGGPPGDDAGGAGLTTSAVEPSAAQDPTTELRQRLYELYDDRSAAISDGDRVRLLSVYTPDAPMLAQDESLIAQLTADGVQLDGFALTIVEVAQVTIEAGTAEVIVVDQIAPFELIEVDGTRTKADGRPESSTALTLVMGEAGWLIRTAERV